MGFIDAAMTLRQQQLLQRLGLPVAAPALDQNALLTAMQHDKKTENGQLRFVLPRRMGYVEVTSGVEVERVRRVLRSNQN
jgi:3-dehydroquinate synthase